jgi:CRP-like cAMP-binding protein
MLELLSFLNSIHPLSDGLKEFLSAQLVRIDVAKKKFILRQGHICENIYFVEKGLVRCFYVKDEKEISSWFMAEGDVIASVESFFNQTTSYESIQALEDCTLYYLSYKEMQYAYREFPEFNVIGRVLVERYYKLSEQRLYSLRMQRAFEKYHYLLENFPQLIQRVPSKYLASYLSITEETLSRMRALK